MSRALYYPGLEIIQTVTPFGILETNHPELYNSPITNKTIVRVDLLHFLGDLFGESFLMSRNKVYTLVSGKCESDEKYKKLLLSYYSRYASFTNYVNDKAIFKSKSTPLIKSIWGPILANIEEQSENMKVLMHNKGGKFLMESHGYLWFAFLHSNVPKVDGGVIIC